MVAEHVPPPPPAGDDFPLWGQAISHVVLVFQDSPGDTKPRPDGDGYCTVKIGDWCAAAGDHLDDSTAAILAWLEANEPAFTEDAYSAEDTLLGASIKGGQESASFYPVAPTTPTAPTPTRCRRGSRPACPRTIRRRRTTRRPGLPRRRTRSTLPAMTARSSRPSAPVRRRA
jgi:hypothetical protein